MAIKSPESLGLMTLRQAVDYLGDGEGRGPSLETLRYYTHRLRIIPKYKLGAGRGHVYVRKADLDALVARGKAPSRGTLRMVREGDAR